MTVYVGANAWYRNDFTSLLWKHGRCSFDVFVQAHSTRVSCVQDEIAPNVMAMVKSFNRLALLVPTEILEETTPLGRAKVISKYIKVRVGGWGLC